MPQPQPAPDEQPTKMRYFVVLVAMLMAVLLYLDRFCVGIAEPYIKQDLNLSMFQMGMFFSAFFLTYALFQVPSGWMTDRYGARVMLVVYVLAWSFFTAMMGLSFGFIMLILMRAAYGLGQAGAYPTSASIISKWVPFSARGTASSIVAFGGRLGGFIAPILTAFLIVQFVPASESSFLNADEILEPDKLCYAVAPPDGRSSDGTDGAEEQTAPRSEPEQRIWSLLDTPSREFFTRKAEEYRPAAEKIAKLEQQAGALKSQRRFIAARDKMEAADALRLEFSDDAKRQVAEALNTVIRSDSFYRPNDAVFQNVVLGRTGRGLRHRADAGETLSEAEQQRLNRLLLEALFSDSLGKVYVGGWRPVMISYGLLGLVVALLIWRTLRNRPEEHPRCNAAEQQLIAQGRPKDAPGPHGKAGRVPWGRLLRSGSMWLNCLSQFGTNIGWIFILTWFPRYLLDEHSVSILERGTMASVPMFIGWFGMLSGGRLTDFLVHKVGLKWGRRLPWGGSRFIGVAAFASCPFLAAFGPWAVTIALAVAAFSTDLGTASGWAFCQDVGGRYVGSVLGWGNMWGNLGATVGPMLLAWVISDYGYTVMFYVCATAFVMSGLCGLGIDATVPIAPPEEEEE